MTSFSELATNVNFGGSYYARGLFPPLLRSMNHIIFALAGSTAEPPMLTPTEVFNELQEASAHLADAYWNYPTEISATAIDRFNLYKNLIAAATMEHDTDGQDQRLRTLAAAAADLAAFLDWEFVGVPTSRSDPGSAL